MLENNQLTIIGKADSQPVKNLVHIPVMHLVDYFMPASLDLALG